LVIFLILFRTKIRLTFTLFSHVVVDALNISSRLCIIAVIQTCCNFVDLILSLVHVPATHSISVMTTQYGRAII